MAEAIKKYTDKHIAKAVARGLRQRGVEVLTAKEAGLLGADDEDHLSRAKAEGRVFVTRDEDSLRFAAQSKDHTGIVYAPQQTSIGKLVKGLMLIHDVLEPSEMCGHVEYV